MRKGIKECAMYYVLNGLDIDSMNFGDSDEKLMEEVEGVPLAMIAFACGVTEESASRHVVKYDRKLNKENKLWNYMN